MIDRSSNSHLSEDWPLIKPAGVRVGRRQITIRVPGPLLASSQSHFVVFLRPSRMQNTTDDSNFRFVEPTGTNVGQFIRTFPQNRTFQNTLLIF